MIKNRIKTIINKKIKDIKKESLRDNMIAIEVALTDLWELTTREWGRLLKILQMTLKVNYERQLLVIKIH